MRALECVREDLADGSVMFRFVETASSNPPTRTRTPKTERLSRHGKSASTRPDAPGAPAPGKRPRCRLCAAHGAKPGGVRRVHREPSERAAMYVLSTPFRAGFWAVAHALRLTFWACTGRLWNRGRRLGVVGYDDAVGEPTGTGWR